MAHATPADQAWCDTVVAQLHQHHARGPLDDAATQGWLDQIGRALGDALGEYGTDLDDPRQRAAIAAAALVVHGSVCTPGEDSPSAEELGSRLACLLAALTHTVIHHQPGGENSAVLSR